MLQKITPSVQEETDRRLLNGNTVSIEEFRSWQHHARQVARYFGHRYYSDFTFSEQNIVDVSERILGISVTDAYRNFDPDRGVKFTTYLYRILEFYAIKEYASIRRRSCKHLPHAFWTLAWSRTLADNG